MQLCLTVICWAQRWVEERGARQVLLGVSAKWPSTCQYQVSGREGEGERACMCDISVERKRWDCCCRMKREDAVDFFFVVVSHYTNKLCVKNASAVFLTPPHLVKGGSSKLVCLTIQSRVFFWVAHEWTHCSTTSSGCHDSFEGNFSKWFYHWTCAQSAGIAADWQHILYASALWHRLMSCPSLSGGMMRTLTQIQLKLKSSPSERCFNTKKNVCVWGKPSVSVAHRGGKYLMWKQPCMVFCTIPKV